MSYVLDTTTTDAYQYLECPETVWLTVQISNAAVSIGFGKSEEVQFYKKGSAVYPPADEPLLPVVGSLERQCDEVRIKSYTPGTPARVMIVAHDKED